jgi:hypothetical protein
MTIMVRGMPGGRQRSTGLLLISPRFWASSVASQRA